MDSPQALPASIHMTPNPPPRKAPAKHRDTKHSPHSSHMVHPTGTDTLPLTSTAYNQSTHQTPRRQTLASFIPHRPSLGRRIPMDRVIPPPALDTPSSHINDPSIVPESFPNPFRISSGSFRHPPPHPFRFFSSSPRPPTRRPLFLSPSKKLFSKSVQNSCISVLDLIG